MATAGVPMMVGTDGGGFKTPGSSIHQEFDELEKAGLSPLTVLQMATFNPARYLGRESTMGQIAPGQNADIVVLDANPIESVQNLHSISAVIRGGRYYTGMQLEALRQRVAAGRGLLEQTRRPSLN